MKPLAPMLVVGIIAQVIVTLVFVLSVEPHAPGFTDNLTIDGSSYLEAARQMAETGAWLYPPRPYHSVGHQILVGAITRVGGLNPLSVKLFNFACFVGSLFLVFAIGRRIGMSRNLSLLAVFFVASSILVERYVATMQYEVFAMTLLAGATLCALRGKMILFGILVGALCLLRFHVGFIAIPLVALMADRIGRREALKGLGIGGLVVLTAWALYSFRYETLRGFQGFPSLKDTRWLCRGAEGWNFPYFIADAASVCGWDLILSQPDEYLALLGRRLAYWVGWRRDVWWVGIHSEWIEKSMIILNVAALFYAFFARDLARPVRVFVCCILVSGLPFVLAGASTRFLVPVMPFILLTSVFVYAQALRRWRPVPLAAEVTVSREREPTALSS